MPLSCDDDLDAALFSPGAIEIIIFLSMRSTSSSAYLALRIRLIRICNTLCRSTRTGGTAENCRSTIDAVPLERANVHGNGVLYQPMRLEVFENAADLGVALLHRHDFLNVLDIAASRSTSFSSSVFSSMRNSPEIGEIAR